MLWPVATAHRSEIRTFAILLIQKIRYPVLILLTLMTAACSKPEILPDYSPDNPAGIDLSGIWQLQGDPRVVDRQISEAIRITDGLSDRIRIPTRQEQQRQRPSNGRSSGGLAHVFFENGNQLKVTQTPDGLFISFDRAVVEEYRFGENRKINVGQAEAQRVSGWVTNAYVIETLDRNGMRLTERFALSNNGSELVRSITFRGKDRTAVNVVQVFERQ